MENQQQNRKYRITMLKEHEGVPAGEFWIFDNIDTTEWKDAVTNEPVAHPRELENQGIVSIEEITE